MIALQTLARTGGIDLYNGVTRPYDSCVRCRPNLAGGERSPGEGDACSP
jgi:hypothetical protein